MERAVVSLSGGMDSATLLAKAINRFGVDNVNACGFHYGSKHNTYEQASALQIAEHFDVSFAPIILPAVGLKSNLLKNGGEIPEGHYEDASMEKTVVPGRNMIFISYLTGLAWSYDARYVWIGIHSGDHAIYPDCRPGFYKSMRIAVKEGSGDRVQLDAPYLYANKTEIIREGLKLGVPYHLTRTCYKDQPISCGKCGACQERLEAFQANCVEDPIEYESREILPKSA